MSDKSIIPTYHVLLIGIDQYPPDYNSLSGCVNDIDAVEKLLLEPPGIGFPVEQIKITRLAAPHPGRQSTSFFQAKTLLPTKANLIVALKRLATTDLKKTDRVLIYYSGHGVEIKWKGSSVWHEALVPHDGRSVEYLFDVEVNGLINSIAAQTNDLTVVLDCCHSAGVTRDFSDIHPQGAVRTLKGPNIPVMAPDLTAIGLSNDLVRGREMEKGLLQSSDPEYLVVVACQSDESANEGALAYNKPSHGAFTISLLSVLGDKDAAQRADLRWADIWSTLIANVADRNAQLRQRMQHPWLIGHSERKVFGGSWEKMDLGYSVTKQTNDDYEIGAGRLMGVTEGAEIVVYGPEPRLFPTIGSELDKPIGSLKVSQAGPSSAIATAVGATFTLPEGTRGRLVKAGESERLKVSLKPENAVLKVELEKSPLLNIVSATTSDVEVEVIAQPNGAWIIGNDTEILLANVPPDETKALQAGLECYYRYNTVLRMARNCNDPQISNSLSVKLLDCNDQAALKSMSSKELADPNLSEAPKDQNGIYQLRQGFKFCAKVINNSRYPLNVTIFDCSSGGMVQYLSDALLRKNASQVMWLDNELGAPFVASPDDMPIAGTGVTVPNYVIDRLIVIGTTRTDVDLKYLSSGMDKTVQQVVNENLSKRPITRGNEKGSRPKKMSNAPAELWTATVTPIQIRR